ncbi:MAG: STAS domain-containing protein [Deltaproteobacteria bacterium]|nr:STAS domain-containing protein [Deltaproteobacteria bacterium]
MYQKIADISVFDLSGDLDMFEGHQLMRSLARLIRRQWVKIVLDFGEVEHINYKILTDLASIAVASHTLQGEIKFANVSDYHRNILKVAGVDSYFRTYDSLADAILSFEDGYASSAGPC